MKQPPLLLLVFVLIGMSLSAQSQRKFFDPGPVTTVGVGSGEVFLTDLNRDGHLDLLTKHLLTKRISIRLGDGTAHFGAASEIRLDYEPGAIQLGDLNEDGIPDLAIASREGNRELIHIFLGSGDAHFKEAANSPVEVSASFEFYKPTLYFTDANEDSKLDILTANGRRNRIELLLGDGRGGFSRHSMVDLEPAGDMYTFAVGDLDGDGHQDIVTSLDDGAAGRVTVVIGDGTAHFRRLGGLSLNVSIAPRIGLVADLNGDNRLDLVITHGRSRSVDVLLNRGNGRFEFAPSSPYTAGGEANATLSADVNRDGIPDLIAASVNSVTLLLGSANGFTNAVGSPFPAGPGAYKLAGGDLNEDGGMDFVASSFESDAVTLLLASADR
jgi:hypothetical protein